MSCCAISTPDDNEPSGLSVAVVVNGMVVTETCTIIITGERNDDEQVVMELHFLTFICHSFLHHPVICLVYASSAAD